MTRLITRPRHEIGFAMPRNMRSFFEDAAKGTFNGQVTNYVPRVDISQDAKHIYLHAELPGLTKEDVQLTVSDGTLTLKGEKKQEEKSEDKNYLRIERRYGQFMRQFTLPENVIESEVHAQFTNGVLDITIPKSEPTKPQERVVPINVNLN
ncbi:MAG: Hsp20/alpha crystallin family protein [bacterium]